MTVQDALEAIDAPEGVKFNFIESTQEVEVVINGEYGQVIMIEEVDPIREQLENDVPGPLFAKGGETDE